MEAKSAGKEVEKRNKKSPPKKAWVRTVERFAGGKWDEEKEKENEEEKDCAARYCEFVTELLSSFPPPPRRSFLRYFRSSSRRPFGVTSALFRVKEPGRHGRVERIYSILNPFSLERFRSRKSSAVTFVTDSSRPLATWFRRRSNAQNTCDYTCESISVLLPRQHADRLDNSRSPSCNYLPWGQVYLAAVYTHNAIVSRLRLRIHKPNCTCTPHTHT